ncbi:MAG: hypothetical protein H7255_05655 [Ramlibacter sp.]|nr:hypothetical protein [Ramlibacter sp.]
MTLITHNARIAGPVPYGVSDGVQRNIPLGPCIVEQRGGTEAEIVWGARGQNSAALSVDAVVSARNNGYLVLID